MFEKLPKLALQALLLGGVCVYASHHEPTCCTLSSARTANSV
nr:MAG TPA: hypothetical protein [Caudoviricetes sp.]